MKSEPIKISIVVTSYNYENLIKETLDSLLSQTYTNFEVIVVDDGSKDQSVKVIEEYCKKDNRVFLYLHPNGENRGLSASTQLALSKATGEYIAFCESDDYWDDKHLETKVNYLRATKDEVNILVNDLKLIGDIRPGAKRYVDMCRNFLIIHQGKNIFSALKKTNYIPTFSCAMVKRSILEQCNFDSPTKPWLDYWLWKQVLLLNKIYYINEHLTYWRMHPNSYNSKDGLDIDIFEEKAEQFLSKKYPEIYRNIMFKDIWKRKLKNSALWLFIARLLFCFSLFKKLPKDYKSLSKVKKNIRGLFVQ